MDMYYNYGMKSVRFDPRLEEELVREAEAAGISQSAFIRQAVEQAVERASAARRSESPSLFDRISDLVGTVSHGSLRTPNTHDAFVAIVEAKHKRRRA